MEMANQTLKPLAPYFKGQIVGYVEKREMVGNYCSVGNWLVIATEPQQESLAQAEIADHGLTVYLPIIPRQENHGRGSTRLCERPMFPSYLFVCCLAEGWHKIKSSRGVRRIIGDIPDAAIEVVRYHESEKADEEAARLAASYGARSGIVWHFSPDDKVRITKGPFSGFSAKLETAVDAADRIKALVSIFGRQSTTELSAFDIEKL